MVENMNYDTNTVTGSACKAVLQYCANSHPFEERTLTLSQPVKIGRLLAKAKVCPNNGIFDCKVLSRNHALLWYENNKFYLQDTKSSNGTFVNNHRLSKSGEESKPQEVFSGDIVQFGVDVIENSKNISHGCITAILKLYNADGSEAKANPINNFINDVSTQDLYTIDAYIREAMHRELNLENKLLSLEKLLSNIIGETDNSWKALVAEDRLLSKIEFLESQLQYYKKDIGEDEMRKEICDLKQYKYSYQGMAKDCLKKEMEDKLKLMQKCQELENLLKHSTTEQNALMKHLNDAQTEIKDLCAKLNVEISNHENTVKEYTITKELYETELKTLKETKNEIENSFHNRCDEVESLKAEIVKIKNKFNSKNIFFSKLENDHEFNEETSLNQYLNDISSNVVLILQSQQTCLTQINNLHCQMHKNIKQKSEIEKQICQLQTELDLNKEYIMKCIKDKNVAELSSLDSEKLKMIIIKEENLLNLEEFSKDIEIQIEFYKKKCDNIEGKLSEFKDVLQDCIRNLEDQESSLKHLKKELSCKEVIIILISNYLYHLSSLNSNNIFTIPNILQKNLDCFHDSKDIDNILDNLKSSYSENLKNESLIFRDNVENETLPDSQTDGYLIQDTSSVTTESKEDSNIIENRLENLYVEYNLCITEKNSLKYELEQTLLKCKELEQYPNFHLFFALPSIVLFLVLVIRFYTYLSYLTGTAD
ncbi:sarcolemmal membrane-associated protein [Daktulosphaira vitifoliae]|uniref:sarcolemmal membrane-associated protein n=1 Tax=Daktulosphaira vitifoliae TaxID=58002 RepID=UPI0021A9E574|nr:sarcolemmal membrane-associated protein [Daktulosphaira vitifoliae]